MPNPIYNPMPGYMMDYDVKTTTENIEFREKDPVPGTTGQLLASNTGFLALASGGNTVYVRREHQLYGHD